MSRNVSHTPNTKHRGKQARNEYVNISERQKCGIECTVT